MLRAPRLARNGRDPARDATRRHTAKSPVAPNHITRTHPEWVRHYGKTLWLDPGEKGVQGYSLNVVIDVVKRYDIDGVHFDDYFYPYIEQDSTGRDLDFPDETSWRRFGAGTRLSRADWRRQNIDLFVRQVYRSIKAAKPWVKFGISPFGIWRPGYPAQIKGFDAYTELYADARKWLQNGWCDYFTPQLYWKVDPQAQSYPVLLHWWVSQNRMGRNIVPGNFTSRVGDGSASAWTADELLHQIGFVQSYEQIEIEVAPGELREVTMHDGSRILLKKLEEDYDPSDTVQALQRLHRATEQGHMLTGLVYLRPEKKSFINLLNMTDRPLYSLGEAETRPPKEALDKIMRDLM